jgi:hypothetical protein
MCVCVCVCVCVPLCVCMCVCVCVCVCGVFVRVCLFVFGVRFGSPTVHIRHLSPATFHYSSQLFSF